MDARLKYRYLIARFMPNQLRGEFVNVGIILQVVETGQLFAQWIPDLGRMRCLSKDVTFDDYNNFRQYIAKNYNVQYTVSMLNSPETIIAEPISKFSPIFLDYLHQEITGQFQFSQPVGGLTNNPAQQVNRLFEALVRSPEEEEEEETTHSYKLDKLRTGIERALKSADLLGPEKIVRQLQVPGKSHQWSFDYGRLNGHLTVVEAVSMTQKSPELKLNKALILYGKINDVKQGGQAPTRNIEAYAVIQQDTSPERMEGLEEAKEVLQKNQITTVADYEVPRLVQDLSRSINKSYFLI